MLNQNTETTPKAKSTSVDDVLVMLARSREIFNAWADWPSISYEDRLRTARLANEMSPESVQQRWEEDVKAMKENPYAIPTSVRSYVGAIKTEQIVEFINKFVSKLQVQGVQDLDSLNLDGEEFRLLEGWKKKIEDYRGRNN